MRGEGEPCKNGIDEGKVLGIVGTFPTRKRDHCLYRKPRSWSRGGLHYTAAISARIGL